MKKIAIIPLTVILAACSSTKNEPDSVGIANPASVYCQKVGGTLDIVKDQAGEVGFCTLPNGARIEEWELYRRDNK